jgi:hypothetical protein
VEATEASIAAISWSTADESSGSVDSGTVVASDNSMVASTCVSGIDVVGAGSGTSAGSGSSASGDAYSDPIAGTKPAKPAAAAMVTPHRARRAGCGFRGIRSRRRVVDGASTLVFGASATEPGWADPTLTSSVCGGPHVVATETACAEGGVGADGTVDGDLAGGVVAGGVVAGVGATRGEGDGSGAAKRPPRLARRRASRSSVVSSDIVDLSSRP